jgi:hypothetical protein
MKAETREAGRNQKREGERVGRLTKKGKNTENKRKMSIN